MSHRIVDIRKLDENRDLADEVIAEKAIEMGCNRLEAALGVATDLGFHVQLQRDGIWWFISAVAGIDDLRIIRAYLKRGPRAATEYEARLRTMRHCVALTAEDACLALICQLLAPELDLFMKEDESANDYRQTYRAPDAAAVWFEWADSSWDNFREYLGEGDIAELRDSFKGVCR
ncbi:MAG TPA: hypothetical protein VF595_12560 [Tepidisphaeraceae bacterium]|jgi:hypothetical protein